MIVVGAAPELQLNRSCILEIGTTEKMIPDYSDAIQHVRKSTRFSTWPSRKKLLDHPTQGQSRNSITKKIFDTAKHPSEGSGTTKDVFSPNQTDTILSDLRTFARPDGLKITNCIFRRDHVEICYLFQGNGDHNKDELRKQLSNHLKIASQLIKLTKLRSRPIYKETSITPGEAVTIDSKGTCKIGAFVEVQGKGNYALMSGHGKDRKDKVRCSNGDLLGVVNVSLNKPLKPTGDYSYCGYLDVALAKLDNQDGYTGEVFSNDHGPLHLVEQPSEAVEGMNVRCFDSNGNRGKVDSTAYIRHDDELSIDWRMISVKNDADEPVHEEGESGILIVDDVPDEGSVQAVGMLVGIDELALDDEEETIRKTSLAVPLTTNFEALQNDPHCSGGAIKFLH